MAKPVPSRFPPARMLSTEQTAFIQSLEPQPVRTERVTEPTEQPIDSSSKRPVTVSTETLVDESLERSMSTSTETLVDEPTKPQVAQSTHSLPAASPRPSRSRANKRQGRALFERANGKPVRKLSFYLPADLAKSLQIHCVATERDMSAFVTELVRRALTKSNA